jgi:hypothetical protein
MWRGNPYRTGRLSTVEFLVLNSKATLDFKNTIYFFTKAATFMRISIVESIPFSNSSLAEQ